jgi:hypothetical protein
MQRAAALELGASPRNLSRGRGTSAAPKARKDSRRAALVPSNRVFFTRQDDFSRDWSPRERFLVI